MDWIDSLNKAEAEDRRAYQVRAELKLYNIRVLEARANELWVELSARLKSDCKRLAGRCQALTLDEFSIRLIGTGSPIRTCLIRLATPPYHLRIRNARYSDMNRIIDESAEKVSFELQADDSVVFIKDGERYPLVEDISRLLISKIV